MLIAIREYLNTQGESPFDCLFGDLNALSTTKVATALYRLEEGNYSKVEGVGGDVFECKINLGPVYWVYFGKDWETLIILLGGGSKKRQHADISAALSCWQDYKRRQRYEGMPWLLP